MSELKKNSEAQEQQDVHRLMQVRLDKLNELKAAGKDPFEITTYEQSHHAAEIKAQFEALKDTEVSVAGRMMSKRIMGKASFCAVRDLSGDIQIYVARDAVGEEAYAQFKKYDIGDIIGVRGKVFETKTGERKSRIRATLTPGSIVSDPRSAIHYLVTEYGMVNLKGVTNWQRAERIISIAHPDFRDELIQEAEKMHIWRKSNKR